MYGAIIGDIIGSPFEFDRGQKSKAFELLSPGAHFTDDSVMTVAVAEALLDAGKDASLEVIREKIIASMQKWGHRYPYAGYGTFFRHWLGIAFPKPYGSYGNGSAMRVSAVGWLYDTLERTREVARATADVTHNHPEGIKGAEATASIIFMARNRSSKEDIKAYIVREFHYDLSCSIEAIRPSYHHVESCQETVPEAITAFLEGSDFEDVIRTAVSLGGDSDTLTDIAAAMAEAYYGIPAVLRAEVRKRVKPDMLEVLNRFDSAVEHFFKNEGHAFPPDDNKLVEQAIGRLEKDGTRKAVIDVLDSIHSRMEQNGRFLFPAKIKCDINEMVDINREQIDDAIIYDKPLAVSFGTLQSIDGKRWMVAFTSKDEYEKGERVNAVISQFIDWILEATLQNDAVAGIVINPWGQSLSLPKELIQLLMKAHRLTQNQSNTPRVTSE